MFLVVNTKKNFWDLNPDMIHVGVFSDLVKSKGKRRSSSIMWSIYLARHPSSAVYKAFDVDEDRDEEVNTSYNSTESAVAFEELEDVITMFIKISVSQGVKTLNAWEQDIKELDNYIESLDFKNGFKLKKEALIGRKELWDMYLVARNDFFIEESEMKAANRGGYRESWMEEGISKEDIENYG